MTKPRDYDTEYKKYGASREQKLDRAARTRTRRKLKREGKSSKDGKEIDHKDGNPRNGARSNLRVIKRSTNRAKH